MGGLGGGRGVVIGQSTGRRLGQGKMFSGSLVDFGFLVDRLTPRMGGSHVGGFQKVCGGFGRGNGIREVTESMVRTPDPFFFQ